MTSCPNERRSREYKDYVHVIGYYDSLSHMQVKLGTTREIRQTIGRMHEINLGGI